jgi:hypothetical protein
VCALALLFDVRSLLTLDLVLCNWNNGHCDTVSGGTPLEMNILM